MPIYPTGLTLLARCYGKKEKQIISVSQQLLLLLFPFEKAATPKETKERFPMA